MANAELALPWGEQREEESVKTLKEGAKPIDLKAGQRVRVLWEIHDDDDNVVQKWWGARLQADVGGNNMDATLRYDAHEGFEEEEASVRFISSDMLKDGATEQELYWLTEEEYEQEEAEQAVEDPNAVIHVKDLAHGSEDLAQLEAQAMQRIQQLPMDKQLHMAEGFRKFMDHMQGQIRAKANASGDDTYVVTEADVHEMVAGLQKAK